MIFTCIMLCVVGQVSREKAELVARSDKLTNERDRLIKERTSAEKQLRDSDVKLKEMIEKVGIFVMGNLTCALLQISRLFLVCSILKIS